MTDVDMGAVISATQQYGDDRAAEASAAADAKVIELSIALSAEKAMTTTQRLAIDKLTLERDDLQEWIDNHNATEHAPPVDPKVALREAWGICVHPNFATKPAYSNPDKVMAHVRDAGARMIRGMFADPAKPGAAAWKTTLRTLELCREYEIRWVMTLVPEDWPSDYATIAERKIKWLHDNGWDDVVEAFEGPNEAAHARGGGSVPTDWAQRTLAACKSIKKGRDQHMPDKLILSPAMHDIQEDNSGGAGYKALAALGVAQYVDRISMHSYPKGSEVTTGFEARLELARLAYPAPMKVWITETGWTTYTRKTGGGGPQATTEADAARYGSEAPAIIAAHPVIEKAFRYEGEDDALPADTSGMTNAEIAECCYGMWRANGTPKPEATELRKVLAS